jgi:hypothetical protein
MTRSSTSDRPENQPHLEELSTRLGVLESKLYAAKIAYLNHTELGGKEVTYEDLNAIAKEYIQTSYSMQKAKFGSIKVRMSVAKLLR